MCPALFIFPRQQFYDGQGLKDSQSVLQDNPVREAMRKMTKEAGALGDLGDGTEYLVMDVANGCSRVEINGTSLVNHANATVIIDTIDRLIRTEGITAAMIKILCYYQGQRPLLRQMIDKQPWTDRIKAAIEISTVDAFQGRESQIVIVDMVAARDRMMHKPTEEETPDDLEDREGEDYIKAGSITSHVRSPNRLNVALTRGKNATIVVCQAALLRSHFRKNRGKLYNAVANMIGDAKTRSCIIHDYTEDSHPSAVEFREKMDKRKFERERAAQRQTDLGFIADSRPVGNT